MDKKHSTDAQAFQRFLTEQLKKGKAKDSPEKLLQVWRKTQKRGKTPASPRKSRKKSRNSKAPSREISELGRRLQEISDRYIAQGGELLTIEQLDRELAERRGERGMEE
jgi:hypothetical protein